ncbi:MAG: YebC/PmpR family DNA-binding transcriptional regulator [Saprospiraceae bacterium]|nr:YebC/PmpR family DNA-binding transcriptional regulator [Saprospiraceae bacterium]MBP7699387.1 YebC/PmpR family DNA-binding transcriptional regulator [Saprospiraceae bacterium]
MGRAFEYRKATKMKRWANMARAFTKIGKEISIAVKEGGPTPESNPRLRIAIQNAKTANMPKVNIENAIKKASSKDAENYTELVYEGYAPNGIAVLVECATDNTNRTVANIRHIFSKFGGSLGTSGSVDFMFDRKGIFRIKNDGQDAEMLELDLIDHGLDELKIEDEEIVLYTAFQDYGTMQKALEDKGIETVSTELARIPTVLKKLTDEEQVEEVIKMIEKMEDDDDVQNVYHTMDMSE